MSDLININEADIATLTGITGIGEALAARIVAYRETVHPFEEVIELTAVPGISERMVRSFADQVTVEPGGETDPAPAEILEAVEDSGIEEGVVVAETAVFLPEEPAETVESEPEPEPVEIITAESEPISTTQPTPHFFREEIEPDMTTEPTPTASTNASAGTAPSAANDTVSQRRGCLFIIIGAVVGAILGTALTLAVLAAMNYGSLQYAQPNRQIRSQLEDVTTSLNELNQELESANQNLEAVATRAGSLADDQGAMDETLQGVQSTLDNTQEGLTTAQDDIDKLTETAVILDERITTISESAETFDKFLTGMRDLLVDLQGMPAPTITPYATITPGVVAATETAMPEKTETAVPATPSATRVPTRTPRPTSTPISLPTSTPAQQP